MDKLGRTRKDDDAVDRGVLRIELARLSEKSRRVDLRLQFLLDFGDAFVHLVEGYAQAKKAVV